MSDLQAYLASKYLTGAKAEAILARADDGGKRRKKKRKVVAEDYATPSTSRSSLIIDDGGEEDWRRGREEEEEQAMVVESRAHAGFKNIVAKTEPEPEPQDLPDEAPVVVGTIEEPKKPKKLKGGLQTAAEVAAEAAELKAQQQRQREKELKQLEEARKARGADEDEDDTVVRGPDGRPIDNKAAKAEEARKKREKAEKEMQRMEWGKGLVQREDKEKRKEEEAAIAAKPMARFADDVDMNRQMREVERWNDPAAAFLTKKEPSSKKRGPVRPLYKGPPPPPNRFGILPGYRWDGVDRSNGFERKLAQSINERRTRTEVAHSWSVEDM